MTPIVGVRTGQLTVELAVVATLEKWMPTYVVAAARRYAVEGAYDLTPEAMEIMLAGYVFPFRPKGVSVSSDFQDWPIDALPHLQVLSPSWSRTGGDQTGLHIKYDVQVAAVIEAQEQKDTRLFRACYEDAVLGLLQHQDLGGISAGIDLVGGGPAQLNEISGEDARTFQGSIAVFEVLVQGVLDLRSGPAATEPLPDVEGVPPVWPNDPTVAEGGATVELKPEAINGES